MYQVAIVAELPISRAGLEKLASDDPRMQVVSAVASVGELDQRPGAYDVVVLDVPSLTAAAVEQVARAAVAGPPLISSAWEGSPTLLATIRAGARGCLSRLAEQADVSEAIRVIAQGGFYICPKMVGRFEVELAGHGEEEQSGLAPREIETLRWIASGLTHGQIAKRMGLSPATVNTYAKRIRAKLNVTNKADLTRMAIELGHLAQSRRTQSRQTRPAA